MWNNMFSQIRFFVVVPSANQKLEVGYRSHSNGQPEKILSMNDPVPGSYWQLMVASVASDQPFQLMFQAQPGANGSVAIDDIILSSGCK